MDSTATGDPDAALCESVVEHGVFRGSKASPPGSLSTNALWRVTVFANRSASRTRLTQVIARLKPVCVQRVLSLTDALYPERLKALRDPPKTVYLRGPWPKLGGRNLAVAIVGARRASELGRRLAETIAFDLARVGVVIVSGGALGIDGAAHLGAVRAEQPTIVVLPTPIARPSPPSHRALFRRVLETGGVWLSEVAADPQRSHFQRRNRLIAALADLVVVIEGGAHSGTLHTVRAARRLDRPLAAVPWSPDDHARGTVPFEVLRRGGHAIASARDVLALLGRRGPVCRTPEFCDDPTLALAERVVGKLAAGPRTLETLARDLAVSAELLASVVTDLELDGVVLSRSGGLRLAIDSRAG